MEPSMILPRLYVKSRDDQTTQLLLQLTNVQQRCIVRLTGGCGGMSEDDARGFNELFAKAFFGFKGVMTYGGTRMVLRNDPSVIVPGVTEGPALLRRSDVSMKLLGVIPRTEGLSISDRGLVVSDDANDPYYTIAHPDQDMVLVVQVSADDAAIWDAEYKECARITSQLRDCAGFSSLLVSFNGGGVTEREILATAERGWPVLLIKGSGRTTDKLANDTAFMSLHGNVHVADRDAASIRRALETLDIVPRTALRVVSKTA